MAIAHLDAEELATVARNGGGLIVSAGRLNVEDLAMIARNLRASAVLHVVDSSRMAAPDMAKIARNAHTPAFVMFS